MKTNIPRNNFSSGIISQQLSGRIDLPAFSNGLSYLENFLINLNGSISKRTGYELVGKNLSTTNSYFMKFLFNQEQVYLLEFKENYFIVWVATEDNKITQYKENNQIKEFSHPYSFNDLKNIKTTQNFDVIYLCHRNYIPKTLTRTYTQQTETEQATINFVFTDVIIEATTGAENPFKLDGNPSCCAFYQQRLFYAGWTKQINKIWASDRGYYNRFTTNRTAQVDILDIDGFNFILSELKLGILWIKETTIGLILGTAQGIAIIKSDTGQLTPFSFACNLVNKDGASKQDPIIVGTTLLYIDSTLKRIKALTYAFETNSYISTNLNILCPELLQENIKKIIYQEDEKDLVYVLLEDGSLYYLLYSSNEMFYSWGKIKTYTEIKYIEALEKYTSGTNLFLIDSNNNILRKTEEIILKKQEDYFNKCENNKELHNKYYNYLLKTVNEFCYLDYSSEVYYGKKSRLSFEKIEENEQGIYGTLTSDNENEFLDNKQDELVSMTIRNRNEQEPIEFEIQAKNSNNQLKVKLLTYEYSLSIVNCQFNNWSFNKNILDGFDNSIYNDGTNFDIVGDGFNFENVLIKNGKIQLPQGVFIGHFRIGYNYKSILKTMNLGGMIDLTNTMIAKKNILKVYFRLYNSWGGKFGTSYFDLKEINYLRLENTRYGEPFTLEDQDIRLDISDKWEYNKSYFITQEAPYPFNVNSITLLQEQN